MESYSQYTNQYVLAVSSLLNDMSKRGSNVTDFKVISTKVTFKLGKKSPLFFFGVSFYLASLHPDV